MAGRRGGWRRATRWLPLVVGAAAAALAGAALAAPGDLDPSFDGDGRLTINYGGAEDRADDVLVQPDGRIVTAGRAAPAP